MKISSSLVIIIIGVLTILSSVVMGYYEFHNAKEYCSSYSGNYSFQKLPPTHFCNDREIGNYKEGWQFQDERLNLSPYTFNWSQIP